MGSIRLIIGGPLAALVTVALFMLMKSLIIPDKIELEAVEEAPPIELTRTQRDEEIRSDDRELRRPQQQDEPPPPPPPAPQQTTRPDVGGGSLGLPSPDVAVGGLGGVTINERDPQPIVRIPPQFPRRAAQRGQEGYVVVEFTIAADGSVKDPVVVEASSSVFEREAIRAILRWKYRPQIRDGRAADRAGVRVRLDFQLEDTGRRR